MRWLVLVAAVGLAAAMGPIDPRTINVLRFRPEDRVGRGPAMHCLGGCHVPVDEILCRNIGWDGSGVVWECAAHLPPTHRLRVGAVAGMGYDGPGDSMWRAGTATIEYEVLPVAEPPPSPPPSSSSKSTAGFFILVVGALALLLFVNAAKTPEDTQSAYDKLPPAPPTSAPAADKYEVLPKPAESTTSASDSNWPLGLVTALGVGALAGHVMSRPTRPPRPPQPPQPSRPSSSFAVSHSN